MPTKRIVSDLGDFIFKHKNADSLESAFYMLNYFLFLRTNTGTARIAVTRRAEPEITEPHPDFLGSSLG